MSRVRSLLGGLLVAAVSLVGSVLAIEAGGRLAYCLLVEKRLSLQPREPASLFVRDPRLLYRQRPGFDRITGRSRQVRVRVNSLGLRGPERELGRAPGVVRVLALGDSQTWGFDVEEDEAYPQALERLLDAATGAGSPGFEVINAAVPGYSSYHGLVWLQENLGRFRPDAVTVSFNFNDRLLAEEMTSDFSLIRATPERYAAAWRWNLLRRSFVLREGQALMAKWRMRRLPPAAARYRERERELVKEWQRLEPVVTPGERLDHLRGIAALCRTHGVPLILVALPEHPWLAAPLDSATARLRADDPQGATRALAGYFALADSSLLWTYSDYDVLANAIALRARPGAETSWPHRRAPANVVLATAGEYNRITETVATEASLPIVDATAALSAHPEVFFDECHFDGRGHAQVAELLAPVVLEVTGAAGPASVRTR
ncbi:MAG: hypothetical protein A2W00_04765 [Candidatus Eisenbacteria bacterium RBG_16_71_46]|nr:MAG: hypothetical protein A2W00_04765 [Candidatus Eisenbacteria bacterium RBG_16_71_46]